MQTKNMNSFHLSTFLFFIFKKQISHPLLSFILFFLEHLPQTACPQILLHTINNKIKKKNQYSFEAFIRLKFRSQIKHLGLSIRLVAIFTFGTIITPDFKLKCLYSSNTRTAKCIRVKKKNNN